MKKLRIGLAGAGYAANFHFNSFQAIGVASAEVTAVTSLRPESRGKFATEHGLKAYDSMEDMLEQIDIIDIVSPPYAHDETIIKAAEMGKHIICEKPLTGYFGPVDADESFRGYDAPKKPMLDAVTGSLVSIREAVDKAGVCFGYAENFIYAPTIQKEREIIEKTDAQLLRMLGEMSHNGSQSDVYGNWRFSGGGSLVGKACHPLSAVLYLKSVEGIARNGKPIRPSSVSARVHKITKNDSFQDKGYIRSDYHDIEDYGWVHIIFDDGTVADIVSCELVLGGAYSYVEVFANNHRARCRLSPTNLLDVYNPEGSQFDDIYLIEKISSKEGWSPAAPDENWVFGYQAELKDFVDCAANGKTPQADLTLAIDSMMVLYSAYLSAENEGAGQRVQLL